MKLEVGKKYILRDGSATDPIMATDDPQFPFEANLGGVLLSWRSDGRYLANGGSHRKDIVAKYSDGRLPSNAPQQKPRIIQIVISPQHTLYGLGDDGITYVHIKKRWSKYIPAL